jgi:hypothetical protein
MKRVLNSYQFRFSLDYLIDDQSSIFVLKTWLLCFPSHYTFNFVLSLILINLGIFFSPSSLAQALQIIHYFIHSSHQKGNICFSTLFLITSH